MQHHRTVSGFRKVGDKQCFFSYVEKSEPKEPSEHRPLIKDFVSKDKNTSEEKKQESIKKVTNTSTSCGCF